MTVLHFGKLIIWETGSKSRSVYSDETVTRQNTLQLGKWKIKLNVAVCEVVNLQTIIRSGELTCKTF